MIALTGELARTCDGGNVFLRAPAVGDDLTRRLQGLATRYRPHTEVNLRICRLGPLLEAYLPWLSRAPGICPEGLTLRICDTDQHATLVLDQAAHVTDGEGRDEIALSRLDMASFLFWPFPPSRHFDLPPQLACLDAVLPLPFFVFEIGNI